MSGAAARPAPPVDAIAHGELRVAGLLPRASNYTFLAEVGGEGGVLPVVYKPREGETPLWDFPEGTLCRREVAAYTLAEALGWPNVPPTVLRDGPMGVGSVQLFVEHDPAEHYFTLRERNADEFRRVASFDVVAGNGDRKSGHCLAGNNGTLWAVDHGLCFSASPSLRTVIWDFAGEPVPPVLLGDLERVAVELEAGPLRGAMLAMLDEREVDGVARRARALVADGRFPLPGPGRARPWPAI